jgi:hypothetical protein
LPIVAVGLDGDLQRWRRSRGDTHFGAQEDARHFTGPKDDAVIDPARASKIAWPPMILKRKCAEAWVSIGVAVE